MTATLTDRLGVGIYTPAEAARYARVSPVLVHRWLFPTSRGKPVLPVSDDNRESGKIVTFVDFVETLVVRAIRTQHKVSLQKIREAVRRARDQYGIEHPFAYRDRTVLFDGDIHIQIGREGDYHQVSGKQPGQMAMQPIVELYMKDLEFGPDDLANRYRAFRLEGVEIWMDPRRRFGEPLTPSGHSAQVLWEACIAEGGIPEAAAAFGVPEVEVEAAFRYCDLLETKDTGNKGIVPWTFVGEEF